MTVFAVNTSDRDLSAAERYGNLRFINRRRFLYADEINCDGSFPCDVQDMLEAAASDFNPERDYLLIVGDHLQLLQITALLAKRHGQFRVLRYDRKEQAYYSAILG